MKVTFPLMGHSWVPLKTLLESIGLTVIMPPPTTRRTLSLGVQYAPETACLPFKINIGNLIEAKELGADTFIMAGGVGPCRFGLYAQLEKDILEELGYHYHTLILEPPDQGLWQFFKQIRAMVGPVTWWKIFQSLRFAYHKAYLLDQLERRLQKIRPRELIPGTADRIFQHALGIMDKAQNRLETEEAYGLSKEKLFHIPQNNREDVVRVVLVGEIFTLLDSFASQEIEKTLGQLGAEVDRSLYLSDWVAQHLLLGLFTHNMLPVFKKQAKPFLNYFVGGHGLESIGAGACFARKGYDGIVQVAPLTCMPEIVAHSIFPRLSRELDIPVLTLYVDEQTGKAGLTTRLEAFIDLLRANHLAHHQQETIS